MSKHKILGLWSAGLALILFPLIALSSGSGTLTLTNVVDNGDQTYTLTLADTSSLTVGDHLGARITDSTGPGGVWTVSAIPDSTTVTLTDDLYFEVRGSATYWGPPMVGDAWYSTPTAGLALSSPPHNAKAWDGALARNYAVSAAAITSTSGLGTISTQDADAVAITGGTVDGTTIGQTTATVGSFTTVDLTTDLTILNGGTGASDASTARTNLGLGTMATQGAGAVAITGGTVDGVTIGGVTPPAATLASLALTTDLPVTEGGTGSSTAGDARTALGLDTMATQASNSVSISGGAVTGITDLTVADGGTGSSNASDARTALGVALGSDAQAHDATLQSIADVTSHATGDLPVFVSAGQVNLPVGTDTHVLTVDSTEALGVKWAAPAAATMDVPAIVLDSRAFGHWNPTPGTALVGEGLLGGSLTESGTVAFSFQQLTGANYTHVQTYTRTGAGLCGIYSGTVYRPDQTLPTISFSVRFEDVNGTHFAGVTSNASTSFTFGPIAHAGVHSIGIGYEQAASDNDLFLIYNDGAGNNVATSIRTSSSPLWVDFTLTWNSATSVTVEANDALQGGSWTHSSTVTADLPAAAVSLAVGGNYNSGTQVVRVRHVGWIDNN